MVSGYGKTKVQHLEAPFVRGLETYKTERAFPDAGCSSSAAAVFFRFSKILFLEVYSSCADAHLAVHGELLRSVFLSLSYVALPRTAAQQAN